MSWLTDPDEEWSTDEPSAPPGTPRHGAPEPPAAGPAGAAQPHVDQHPAPAQSPPSAPPPPQSPMFPDYRGEWGGGEVDPAAQYPYEQQPVPDTAGSADLDDYSDERPSRMKLVAIVLTGWLVVSIAVLAFLLLVRGPHSNSTTSAPSVTRTPSAGGASTTDSSSSLPDGWVQQATDDQTNCAAHAYGQVPAFLTKTPCSSMHRVLSTTNQGGRTVVIASYTITFNTAARAASFNTLVTSDGTGNVDDLLREGITYPGAPAKLPPAAFASRLSGLQVQVAEAGYTTGVSSTDDATLKKLAALAVAAR